MEGAKLVKVKPTSYGPIEDELSGSTALVQAAATLDAAVFLAVESKNVDKLLDIAAMWMGLAERLGIVLEEDDEEDDDFPDKKDKEPFGFTQVTSDKEPVKEVIVEDA
ncbi:hypothetical protein SEA_ANNADREAMY_50 [Streptomyces phage Annadreamy]|uniref:Uncharacterized protein n=1 Tax=Streptomyces phage Annadreamy TaxID=2250335 RepID=A0A345GT99_9CAUD|nr:hypothetical protein HWB75_gp196 [Streptomyces phage Annadreamy]AXG66171.1 hypothetical protein SEA_ANNADREAMY_50 [Streptomyces phage Annadreamy]